MNHTISINEKSFLKTTISYSGDGIDEDVFKIKTTKIYNGLGEFMHDSIGNRALDYKTRLKNYVYRGAITYNYKLNAKNTIRNRNKICHTCLRL